MVPLEIDVSLVQDRDAGLPQSVERLVHELNLVVALV
jgi:hypothetical protein